MTADLTATEGTTRGRYPYGHDVEGLLNLYDGHYSDEESHVEHTRYWREWVWDGTGSGTWNQRVQFWGSDVMMYSTGDVGYSTYNGKWKAVSTSLNRDTDNSGTQKFNFTRNNHPLGQTSWHNSSIQTNSWRPPGITGSGPGAGRWLTAWTNSRDKFSQSCTIELFWSDSAFGGGWFETLDVPCTQHQPTLGYADAPEVFVLVWGRDNGDHTVANWKGNDSIWAMSYVRSGQEWTEPQLLVEDAMGGPSVSCRQYECDLSFLGPASLSPNVETWRFEVDSDGILSHVGTPQFGSASKSSRVRPSIEDTEGDPTMSYDATFMTRQWNQFSVGDANGTGKIYSHQEVGYPELPTEWMQVTSQRRLYRSDVAGAIGRSPPYLFTVDDPP